MEMMQIVWLVLLVLFVIVEAADPALVSIWFCGGALVALVISLFAPQMIVLQMVAFVVVSVIMVLALRPFAKRFLDKNKVATNADANIGKVCQVVTEIQPARFGRVKLEGLEWMARADVVLPVGTWCRVLAIEGAKVVVTPLAVEEVDPQ
jgi:membrane protein implicated in regulation of membrane protease activity